MSPPLKIERSLFPFPPMPSVTVAQAFSGLHLHENVDLADGLQFFIKGYITCAETEGIAFVPHSCATQALKAFAHHGSWGDGNFPWDRLDHAWKHAAMRQVVIQGHEGLHLTEQDLLPLPKSKSQARTMTTSRRAHIEAEEDDDEEGSIGDPKDPDYDNNLATGNIFLGAGPKHKSTLVLKDEKPKGRTPLLTSSRTNSIYSFGPSDSSDSPAETAAVRRAHKSDTTTAAKTAAASPSQLSSLSSSARKDAPAAKSSDSKKRQRTRALARSSSVKSGSPAQRSMATTSGVSLPSLRPHGAGVGKTKAKGKMQQHQQQRRRNTASGTGDDKLWPFEAIMDSRLAKNGDDVEYRVKWLGAKPTWQPSTDLQDALGEVERFHAQSAGKPGPPAWYVRGLASVQGEGGGGRDGCSGDVRKNEAKAAGRNEGGRAAGGGRRRRGGLSV